MKKQKIITVFIIIEIICFAQGVSFLIEDSVFHGLFSMIINPIGIIFGTNVIKQNG